MINKRIYLAGRCCNEWHNQAKKLLEDSDFYVFNPCTNYFNLRFDATKNDSLKILQKDIVNQNFIYLKSCNIIFFNFENIDIAASAELAYAFNEDKIIIAFGKINELYKPYFSSICTHIAEDLDEAIEYANWYKNC